jgi:hypothetical protein
MNGGNMAGSPGPPGSHGSYHKPELECFGTLRELTQSGGAALKDPYFGSDGDGCAVFSSSSVLCSAPGT